MTVIDASAMVEVLVGREVAPVLLDVVAGSVEAPHLLDVEVASVLRGLERGGKLLPSASAQALRDFFEFGIERHALEPLAGRVWQLRHQFTAYDASYLALAEALEAPLYTCDRKLLAGGHRADVRLVGAG
ncbi:MAG: type II toxin-antitoxin system VapC family toxin [Actinomycetales bacterium]